ncbi:MAG: hypothetical protein AB7I30_23115 [Isosphaeraceae bacterium]
MSEVTSKAEARRFTPAVNDQLEERLVLSSGPRFTVFGQAILTHRAFHNAADGIRSAFTRFATKGLNYGRLGADLQKAVSVIPYNHAGGLSTAMRQEVHNLYSDIVTRQYRPVIGAMHRALSSLNDFVRSEVASGRIVIR